MKVPSPLRGEGKGGGVSGLMKKLVNTAKALRKSQTDAEKLIWRHLRANRWRDSNSGGSSQLAIMLLILYVLRNHW
jgi:hypothetical protein